MHRVLVLILVSTAILYTLVSALEAGAGSWGLPATGDHQSPSGNTGEDAGGNGKYGAVELLKARSRSRGGSSWGSGSSSSGAGAAKRPGSVPEGPGNNYASKTTTTRAGEDEGYWGYRQHPVVVNIGLDSASLAALIIIVGGIVVYKVYQSMRGHRGVLRGDTGRDYREV